MEREHLNGYLRLVAVAAALALSACAQESADAPGRSDVDLWQGELPIREPWLRDHLPDDSLVYVRLPNLLGLFAMPKGNVLDPALRSTANVENVQKIRQGIADNVLPLIPAFSDPRLRLFAAHVRSPIEIAARFIPAPATVIAVNLDLDSDQALIDMVAELGFALTAPLDAEGVGRIDGAGMPAFVQFDADRGRLLVNAGPGVTAESFAELMVDLDRDVPHRMRSMESRVDESGQGLFVWVDVQQAMPAMQMFTPPDRLQQLTDAGLDKVTALAAGWGVADGKSRISIVADVPGQADRGFLPYVSNDISARSVGDPDGLFVLSIPTDEEFSRLEALALQTMNADDAADWQQVKEAVREAAGVTIEEVLAAIGPEVLLVLDRAGDYVAIRLRDPALWDSVVARIAETTGTGPEKTRVAGDTYYHWSLPNEVALMGAGAAADADGFAKLLRRQRDHVYWMRDGDFLYVASVPQILIDRAAMSADTDVGRWLTETQRIDAGSALISITGTSRKLPGRLYAFYIELLQMLADVAVADIDVWSMPTAAQLGLPDIGAFGFTVSLGDPTVAAEFTFENNPGELLGGMGSIAMVGVLAAIAIPAYQDYTVRATIASGLSLAAAQKVAVSEYYLTNGRFPGPEEAAGLSIPEFAGEHVRSITVVAGSGMIVIDFAGDVVPGGGQLMLEPSVEGGSISWSCAGTFENKNLPAACRR